MHYIKHKLLLEIYNRNYFNPASNLSCGFSITKYHINTHQLKQHPNKHIFPLQIPRLNDVCI